jgi:hypothetical protein
VIASDLTGWPGSVCGTIHDLDVDATHNTLAAEHRRLAEGILVSGAGEEDVKNLTIIEPDAH